MSHRSLLPEGLDVQAKSSQEAVQALALEASARRSLRDVCV
jgi:hypothetical protein